MFNAEKYWTQHHKTQLQDATSFSEIGMIAMNVLDSMVGNVAQVCGPISASTMQQVKANLEIFNKTILKLEQMDKHIFTQVPMEMDIQRLKDDLEHYDLSLLEDIYGPLFATGRITTLYFIHGWENSKGSCWEREQAEKLGMNIIDLPADFV